MIQPYTANISFAIFFSIDIESLNNPSSPFLHYLQEVSKYNYMNLWRLLGGTSQILTVHVSIYVPEFTVFRFVSVIFLFLTPLMDRMNITVNSSEALQFFISVIKRIKEERKNKPKVTRSLCWDWGLCVVWFLTWGFSLCRIFQDRVDFMQLMLNAQAPDSSNKDCDSAGRTKAQTRGHLQDIKIYFHFSFPKIAMMTDEWSEWNPH